MRVVFTWPDGQTSVLQREDSATKIEVNGLSPGVEVVVNGDGGYVVTAPEPVTEIIPFPIGTRVQRRSEQVGEMGGPENGSFGRVVYHDASHIGVEWEDWFAGHNCSGNALLGQGWNVYPTDLVAAPLPQTVTPYPDCETECAGCAEPLGNCISEGVSHNDGCLDDMWEANGGDFYHSSCAPEEEEVIPPPPPFQVGDAVRITQGRGGMQSGHVGTVRTVRAFDYGVELPGIVSGDTLNGAILHPYGWYCNVDMLELR